MVIQTITNWYSDIVKDGDPRSQHMALVQNPAWTIVSILLYLFLVIRGPIWMKNRDAWGLRKVLIGYNFGLVLLSGWMMYEYYITTIPNPKFNNYCQKMDSTDKSDIAMRLVNVSWWYYVSKLIEFWDTFFFILRKKDNQITFLHVYHHASMCVLEWCTIKYIPGGVSYFGPMCNCFIHVLMYLYYMLAAFGPQMQKYLWWKRYLTKLQMIQFLVVFVHTSYALKLDCGFPKGWLWLLWFYMIILFSLFSHFYNVSYSNKSQVKKVE